jgi:hypothetical protein
MGVMVWLSGSMYKIYDHQFIQNLENENWLALI